MIVRSTRTGRGKGQKSEITKADLVVLSLLAEKPMHGYQLVSEYERQEVSDWASVSKAQIYYALDKLQRLGLLQELEDESADEGMRDRTVYAPTKAGELALVEELADLDWARTRATSPFTTWVGLSIHARPSAALAVVAERRSFLEAEIDREQKSLNYIKSLTSTRARVGETIVDLVIRQMKIELRWLAEVEETIKALPKLGRSK